MDLLPLPSRGRGVKTSVLHKSCKFELLRNIFGVGGLSPNQCFLAGTALLLNRLLEQVFRVWVRLRVGYAAFY